MTTLPSPPSPRCLLVMLALSAGCGGSVDPRGASWSYISSAIVEPNCATVSCHSRAAAVSGLDFSSPERGYTSLTGLWVWIVDPLGALDNGCRPINGQVVCQREHRPLVVPFDPQQSRLVHMLRADNAPRMPPDRPLAEADIRLIESWIADGAGRGGRQDEDRWLVPQPLDAGADADTTPQPSPDTGTAEDGGPNAASDDAGGAEGP